MRLLLSFLSKSSTLKNFCSVTILFIATLMTSFSVFSDSAALAEKSKEYIQFNAESIASVKQSLKSGKASEPTQSAYKRLLSKADTLLNMKNLSVMDKHFVPPSHDKHDYLSISRYWWPDPKSANGLPWIRKDGITNPATQTDDVDRKRLGKTTAAIRLLSLAYYFSENEKYAQKAVSLINTWFLDEQTKMNPNLQYGQSVPGNPKSRRSGMLDGRIIPERVLDSITLLSESPAWTLEQDTAMNTWLREYLNWLTMSKLGKSGAMQKNNHGSWYQFQVSALAWYLGDKNTLEKAIKATQFSLSEQMNEQGAQEHELQRTRGFFYSCFNLQALSLIANIAEKSNLSLWHYTSEQGRNLKLAVDYLMPVTRGEPWPHASKKIELTRMADILSDMVIYDQDPEYQQALNDIFHQLDVKNQQNIKLSSHEKSVYDEFALLKPQFMNSETSATEQIKNSKQ